MRNDGKKIIGSKHIIPSSSWGKDLNIFKAKAKKRPPKEFLPCTGETCKDKELVFKNKAPKGGECDRCYSKAFEYLRFSKREETPHFDTQFLTRFTLG